MRRITLLLATLLVSGVVPFALGGGPSARAYPNPVATDPVSYALLGRVFSDPQGCQTHDIDGDEVNDVVPPNVSPWAKGNACMAQFLSYEEVIEGSKFMARTYPRFMQVIRLDQAYDDPNYMSAGLPRSVVIQDGKPVVLDRDRRPLYLFKVTDRQSPIPENERLHFVYAGGIHGPERAGAEGQVRAMEDLVTWGARFPDKKIVEAPTTAAVPTAKEALERSVVYFMFPNPDGWARGQTAPVEVEDGSPNLNYTPGFIYQRYNGNGMDLNRDWPTYGYTYRPYTPGSEPETQAYVEVLRGIRDTISPDNPVGQRFAGGIDLHGQLTASAFSYTLLGSGQRDFRKNFATVDQSLRAWADQTTRLDWSPYIGTLIAPVADQWGTVIDTIGYQITGGLGDFFDNEQIGLGAVGIDNEMTLSHIAPNSVFEPILEQMHVDGNKGLIFSQMASMLTETEYVYEPAGKIGYVFNPTRLEVPASPRLPNPGLPAQNDIDAILPCQSSVGSGPNSCGDGRFAVSGSDLTLEFDVLGPKDGIWNGGLTATMTNTHVLGQSAGMLARLVLERWDDDDDTWEQVTTSIVPEPFYANAGQIATVNDPMPGLWRARVTLAGGGGPVRVKLDFNPHTAEMGEGQAAISASSMDFFDDLNRYIPGAASDAEPVTIAEILADPATVDRFDSLVVVNRIGDRGFLTDPAGAVGLSQDQANAYFSALRGFAERGGSLVLTDAALRVAEDSGVVAPGTVGTSKPGVASRYNGVCNGATDPLEKDVCLPGTAGGTGRQAVEPTPLGYTPDGGDDSATEARMDQYWIQNAAWTAAGGTRSASVGSGTGLGQLPLGEGRVVIAGSLFPDPNFAPGGPRDMRFGVASYALTFSAWQVFLNTVDYSR